MSRLTSSADLTAILSRRSSDAFTKPQTLHLDHNDLAEPRRGGDLERFVAALLDQTQRRIPATRPQAATGTVNDSRLEELLERWIADGQRRVR